MRPQSRYLDSQYSASKPFASKSAPAAQSWSQAANATGPESVAALPDAIAMLEEEIAAIKKARPLKAYEKTDATALMPLVKALELRCEVLSDENKRLKGMKEAMKVRSS